MTDTFKERAIAALTAQAGESVARAWLAHQGFTPERIDSLIRGGHDERCEFTGYGFECHDEDGASYHPEQDQIEDDAQVIMFALEYVIAILRALPEDEPKGEK